MKFNERLLFDHQNIRYAPKIHRKVMDTDTNTGNYRSWKNSSFRFFNLWSELKKIIIFFCKTIQCLKSHDFLMNVQWIPKGLMTGQWLRSQNFVMTVTNFFKIIKKIYNYLFGQSHQKFIKLSPEDHQIHDFHHWSSIDR